METGMMDVKKYKEIPDDQVRCKMVDKVGANSVKNTFIE